jgi:membrane protease YdiL (CAAX protease family)
MQKFLRGRFLYIFFITFIVFLYWRQANLSLMHASIKTPSAGEVVAEEMAMPGFELPAPSREEQMKQLELHQVYEIARKRPHTALLLAYLGCVLIAMCVGGLVLTLWAAVTGKLRAVFQVKPHTFARWRPGEFFRILLLVLFVAALLPFVRLGLLSVNPEWTLDHRMWMPVGMLGVDAFVVLLILTFAVGKGPSALHVFGLNTKRWWPVIRTALKGYLGVFPWLMGLVVTVAAVWRWLDLPVPEQPIYELLFLEDRLWVLSLTVLLACVIGPIAEELLFRGILYPMLRRKTSRVFSMLVSGACFSVIHGSPVGFLPILVLGCVFADLYERTGSLWAPISIHVLHNSFMLSMAMVVRHVVSLS